MSATVVYLENVLVPSGRRVDSVEPASIQSFAPVGWVHPFVAFLDGRPILRADWGQVIEHDQALAFIDVNAIPQGGGGGGSDAVRMVAMIAVMYYTGGLAAGLVGATTGLAYSAAYVGIGLAGMALVNAILPTPQPTSPQQAAALAAPSPTYSLQAQGNSARVDGAIPEHFGRMLAYPDFAAQPYAEYSGNEQYLYQLLCIGRGQYDIEAIRIEDTPISSFADIEYEIVQPGEALDLFPAAVVTSPEVSGQELLCISGNYAQSGTSIEVYCPDSGLYIGASVYLEFTSGASTSGTYSVVSIPSAGKIGVTSASSVSTSGACNTSPWIGGFVASDSGSVANYLGLDFIAGRGLYHAMDDASLAPWSVRPYAEIRLVDAVGSPIGGWSAFSAPVYTGATTTPQRYTERNPPTTPGRYEVRVRRLDAQQSSQRYGDSLAWVGLRAYLSDSRTFGDVTLIAMKLRASNSLSAQSSRKINVICTRKIPVWNGSTWSANTATRSIAWPLAYACKQVGLTDAQIDLAALLSLDATWAARGDYFDARFDNFLSFWEAATKIAQAGRAKPYMQGGVMRVMRDQAATVPVAMFSMRNITKGSFKVDYLMPTSDTADAVRASYFDSMAWAPATVSASLPGSTSAKPAKVDLFGVTSRAQAFREATYIAATNRYRRKMIHFSTEMEGGIPSFGDLVTIQHDMPGWGQGGDVVAYNSGTRTLSLAETPVWKPGSPHYITLRNRDGSPAGPYLVTAGALPNDVVVGGSDVLSVYTGAGAERTHFAFGWADTYSQPARILSIKPSSLTRFDVVCVNEDSNVHTADVGVITPVRQTSQLAGFVAAPVVTGVIAYPSRENLALMVLSWPGAPWANSYEIEQSSNGSAWASCGSTSNTEFLSPMLYGKSTQFRVAAVGLARGPWFVVLPDTLPPPAFDFFNIMAQPDGTRQYNFGYSSITTRPADWMGAEIRYIGGTVASPDWDAMTRLQDETTHYTNSPVELNAPLSGVFTFACKSLDTTGNKSTYLVRNITLPNRRLGNVFDEFYEGLEGWPGALTGAHIQDGVIEATDSTTWATLPATWAGWTRWNFAPASPIYYETPVRDFGVIVAGQINAEISADGTVVLQMATSTDGTTWSAWGSAVGPFSTRWLKLRLAVTANGSYPIPIIRKFDYRIDSPMKSEYINDVVISALTGAYRIGVGDIRIPLAGTYSILKRTTVVIQDGSSGTWTSTRIDQSLSPAPRWQFRLNGVLADPSFVDFFVEGFP